MCPVWHLQTSYQSLQHFEGPCSFCMFCRKVADLVCWALRTHRTACNTAKPVNEALKPKSCITFRYHLHLFTSHIIHSHTLSNLSISYTDLFPHRDFVGRFPSTTFRKTTRQFHPQAPSALCSAWCYDVMWFMIHVIYHHVTEIYLDQGQLRDDEMVGFILMWHFYRLWNPESYPCLNFAFSLSLTNLKQVFAVHVHKLHLVIFAWKSSKKTRHSRV